MAHTLLNGESPEVIRYFRHLEYLTSLWEKDKEKYRPILNGKRYLTEAELSGLLKVTQRTLIEHRTNGKLPFYKFGGRVLYNLNRTWIEKQSDFFVESPIILLTVIICYLNIHKSGIYYTFLLSWILGKGGAQDQLQDQIASAKKHLHV